MQTLSDWLAHAERQHPKNIELGLDRVRQVAQRLGLEIVPLYLLGLTAVLFALYEATNSRWIGVQPARVPPREP